VTNKQTNKQTDTLIASANVKQLQNTKQSHLLIHSNMCIQQVYYSLQKETEL